MLKRMFAAKKSQILFYRGLCLENIKVECNAVMHFRIDFLGNFPGQFLLRPSPGFPHRASASRHRL